MFGDIVTDLASVLQGGMGMAVGCNVGDGHAMFEPIHGSAPRHAGQDKVNPIAMILATGEALKWLGERKNDGALVSAGHKVEDAVRVVLAKGETLTYDLVGLERAAKMSEVTSAILAEFGSVQLELNELSRITGAPNYGEKGMKVFRVMQKARTEHGMFPLFADSERGTSIGSQIAFGGMGDSFYEYLLKVWLQTGRKHQWLRDMYDKAMDGMIEHVLQYSSPSHLAYIPNYNGGGLERKMDHLTCFMPGLLALGTVGMPDSARKTRDLRVAKEVMKTCWLMYHRTATGIAPEYVNFGGNDFSVPDDQPYYMLRPETIESLHVMHEVTGDPIYREWGWQIFESILKHCRAKYGFGHLTDVRNTQRPAEDKMESFWVAETLKYHYLLQTPGTGITNDKWVFNTEAHPLPMPKK